MNPVTFVLVNLAVIFLLKVGAIRVDNGSLSQGNVIALYNLMSQILVELVKFANLVVTVTKAVACGERIEGVLGMQGDLKKSTNPRRKRIPISPAISCSITLL